MTLSPADPLCLANIKSCCAASKLVYTQPTFTDAASGESVLIQQCGDCTVIAFPGTHDLRDILRDVDCRRVSTTILGQPCSVHAGFNRTHNALIQKIIESVSPRNEPQNNQQCASVPSPPLGERVGVRGLGENVSDERQKVSDNSTRDSSPSALFLTGHSKGAAVARRCALALLENNIPVAGLITFGEPRGGDARYARICDAHLGGGASVLASRSLRITNAADPVPWLPAWLAGNRHAGVEGWLPSCSGVSMSADGGRRPPLQLVFGPRLWWQLLLNSFEIFRAWQLRDLAPLADHHIDHYLARINVL